MVQLVWIFIGVGSRCDGTRCPIVGSAKMSGGMVWQSGIEIFIELQIEQESVMIFPKSLYRCEQRVYRVGG